MSKQDQPNRRDHAVGGWIRQMESDGGDAYYSGRRRTSGLNDDLDAVGEQVFVFTFVQPGAIAIAREPGLCDSCGAAVNPLTFGCRC